MYIKQFGIYGHFGRITKYSTPNTNNKLIPVQKQGIGTAWKNTELKKNNQERWRVVKMIINARLGRENNIYKTNKNDKYDWFVCPVLKV